MKKYSAYVAVASLSLIFFIVGLLFIGPEIEIIDQLGKSPTSNLSNFILFFSLLVFIINAILWFRSLIKHSNQGNMTKMTAFQKAIYFTVVYFLLSSTIIAFVEFSGWAALLFISSYILPLIFIHMVYLWVTFFRERKNKV